MLNEFAFRRKIYYLCTSEEEKARKQRVFSSFLCENGQKSGCSTKHLENFIGRSEKFLSESGFSLGEVGARIDDIESSKVKRYLFSNPAFLPFWGNQSRLSQTKKAAKGKKNIF